MHISGTFNDKTTVGGISRGRATWEIVESVREHFQQKHYTYIYIHVRIHSCIDYMYRNMHVPLTGLESCLERQRELHETPRVTVRKRKSAREYLSWLLTSRHFDSLAVVTSILFVQQVFKRHLELPISSQFPVF